MKKLDVKQISPAEGAEKAARIQAGQTVELDDGPDDVAPAQHHPGPWRATFRLVREGFAQLRVVADRYGSPDEAYPICEVTYEQLNPNVQPQDRANARLLAAAPDLLAAVQFVAKLHAMRVEKGTGGELPEQVMDAIGKALDKVARG